MVACKQPLNIYIIVFFFVFFWSNLLSPQIQKIQNWKYFLRMLRMCCEIKFYSPLFLVQDNKAWPSFMKHENQFSFYFLNRVCVGLCVWFFIVFSLHGCVETLTSSQLLTVCAVALIARSSLVWHRRCQIEYVKHKESDEPLPGLSITHPHQPLLPLLFKPNHFFMSYNAYFRKRVQ